MKNPIHITWNKYNITKQSYTCSKIYYIIYRSYCEFSFRVKKFPFKNMQKKLISPFNIKEDLQFYIILDYLEHIAWLNFLRNCKTYFWILTYRRNLIKQKFNQFSLLFPRRNETFSEHRQKPSPLVYWAYDLIL